MHNNFIKVFQFDSYVGVYFICSYTRKNTRAKFLTPTRDKSALGKVTIILRFQSLSTSPKQKRKTFDLLQEKWRDLVETLTYSFVMEPQILKVLSRP